MGCPRTRAAAASLDGRSHWFLARTAHRSSPGLPSCPRCSVLTLRAALTETWAMPLGSGDSWPQDYERGRPGWPPEVASVSSGGKFRGVETWTGTLSVPGGRDFDTTPPMLSGATSKTVRAPKGAKSVRVTYKVTATDNADSQVPVTCRPRSGSRFFIGRTTVKCAATDSSANTTDAAFTIRVRRTGR